MNGEVSMVGSDGVDVAEKVGEVDAADKVDRAESAAMALDNVDQAENVDRAESADWAHSADGARKADRAESAAMAIDNVAMAMDSVDVAEGLAPEAVAFAAAYLASSGLVLGDAPMPVPADLASLGPGARLGAVLAGVEVRRLCGGQLADVIAGYLRQIAHLEAGLLAAVRELVHTPSYDGGTVVRAGQVVEHADDELAFAATWTGYRAGHMLGAALVAIDTVPALGAA
ncbi:MAG TPA: hypothetical protein VH561_12160, partial [Micromonosporaceae bacterium]